MHAPDTLTLPATAFWLQKHTILVTGSVPLSVTSAVPWMADEQTMSMEHQWNDSDSKS
jgi:hypothetical protein